MPHTLEEMDIDPVTISKLKRLGMHSPEDVCSHSQDDLTFLGLKVEEAQELAKELRKHGYPLLGSGY
jgi:hypothetical protein